MSSSSSTVTTDNNNNNNNNNDIIDLTTTTTTTTTSSSSSSSSSSTPSYDNNNNQPPDHFICSISGEIFKDPVFAADGQTYEREHISKWIKTKGHNATSPLTSVLLHNRKLVPNHAMKSQIAEWHQNNKNGINFEKKLKTVAGELVCATTTNEVLQTIVKISNLIKSSPKLIVTNDMVEKWKKILHISSLLTPTIITHFNNLQEELSFVTSKKQNDLNKLIEIKQCQLLLLNKEEENNEKLKAEYESIEQKYTKMKEEYQEIESNYLLKKKSFENNKTKIDLLKKMNQVIESKMKYIGVLNSNQNAMQGVVLNFDNGGQLGDDIDNNNNNKKKNGNSKKKKMENGKNVITKTTNQEKKGIKRKSSTNTNNNNMSTGSTTTNATKITTATTTKKKRRKVVQQQQQQHILNEREKNIDNMILTSSSLSKSVGARDLFLKGLNHFNYEKFSNNDDNNNNKKNTKQNTIKIFIPMQYQTMIEASAHSGFQLAIAFCHVYGFGDFVKDEKKAFNIISKYHKNNTFDSLAQCMVGEMYNCGFGVKENEKMALKFFTDAAIKGDPYAQHSVGAMLTAMAYEKQKRGYNSNNSSSNRSSSSSLARSSNDEEIRKMFKKSFEWYLKAAKQGIACAACSVGTFYETGILGISRNKKKAFEWYTKAAEQGNARGEFLLGELYLNGFGSGTKNEKKGLEWLKKSSEQGFEEAIRSLKNMENVNKSRHEYLRSLGLGSSDLGDGGNSSNRYHSSSMLNIPMRVHDQIMRSGMHSILRNNPSLDPPSPLDIPHWLSTPSMGSSASSSSSSSSSDSDDSSSSSDSDDSSSSSDSEDSWEAHHNEEMRLLSSSDDDDDEAEEGYFFETV